jgi:hypothetical protein
MQKCILYKLSTWQIKLSMNIIILRLYSLANCQQLLVNIRQGKKDPFDHFSLTRLINNILNLAAASIVPLY